MLTSLLSAFTHTLNAPVVHVVVHFENTTTINYTQASSIVDFHYLVLLLIH